MMLSSGWRRRSVWVGAACLAVAALAARGHAAEVKKQNPPLAPGAVVTYKDASGREWCATIETLLEGPGSEPWAWVSFNTDHRRTGHAPLSELRPGCHS